MTASLSSAPTEERRFVDLHPRSPELADQARGSLLAGLSMPWMTRWPGAFPSSSSPRPVRA